jgi:hypothetical protein
MQKLRKRKRKEKKIAYFPKLNLLLDVENIEFPVVTNAIVEELVEVTLDLGRAMAQAVSRRPLTTEARGFDPGSSPCGIFGGQSGTGTGFSPSTSVFPCQFHSTGPPLKWKTGKNVIIFITGLHNKP